MGNFERKLVIEIHDPNINSFKKVEAAMAVLSKAFNLNLENTEKESFAEETPYLCLRELTNEIYKNVQADLITLYSRILQIWMHVDLEKSENDRFKLNGRVFLNPKNGRYLTVKQWKLIKDDLTKIFKWLYGKTEERIAIQALAMGKILNSMDPENRIGASIKDMNIMKEIRGLTSEEQNSYIINYAKMYTGDLIQDVSNRSRKSIVQVIMNAYNDQVSTKELEDRLFDSFSTMNRDWRRIAETETAINFNNGYLSGELDKNKNEDKPIFMQGISGAKACSFCATQVNNRIVVLQDAPPKKGGDTTIIDGEEYVVIWPGKNNFGRNRKNWWVCPNNHPHCRCTWIRRSEAGLELLNKLQNAMEV